jgi:predicted acylesterase/phospholipase RssA
MEMRVIVGILLAVAGLGGCTTVDRTAVPAAFVGDATVAGYSKVRFWGDDGSSITADDIDLIVAQRKEAEKGDPSLRKGPINLLALSGGGSNGAFGAGVLIGWAESGKRPRFDVVTGISTGALIAPFAFLGTPYDPQLASLYTTISAQDVVAKQGPLAMLRNASVVSNKPLRHLTSTYITDQLLADVAREHNKGRRLLVGTANLDAARPVIWDMGAIAASNAPDRKTLFQDVLLASASIPGIFPPVRISVTVDGRTFDELHVDGGTGNQVFLYPADLSVAALDKRHRSNRPRVLYIIRNGQTTPQYSAVKAKLAPVATRSLSMLMRTQGIGDLYRMYAQATRDKIAYNLIDMPDDFTMTEKEPFDPTYMKSLYARGYEIGRNDIRWEQEPPDYR